MDDKPSAAQDIQVEVIIRQDCRGSQRVWDDLIIVQQELSHLQLKLIDINDLTSRQRPWGGITPTIHVNGELWFLGAYSRQRFLEKISLLQSVLS
jgi:hypothetical protein